jgi:hypothetical protein
VIVVGASAEPRTIGCPLVMVTGLADAELEGTADGDRLVRQTWNKIPPATTTTTNVAITAIRMR